MRAMPSSNCILNLHFRRKSPRTMEHAPGARSPGSCASLPSAASRVLAPAARFRPRLGSGRGCETGQGCNGHPPSPAWLPRSRPTHLGQGESLTDARSPYRWESLVCPDVVAMRKRDTWPEVARLRPASAAPRSAAGRSWTQQPGAGLLCCLPAGGMRPAGPSWRRCPLAQRRVLRL